MENKKNLTTKSITATFFALIVALGIFAMVSPVQAQVSGVLYAGGSHPGYVYEYTGGTSWGVISPDLGSAVLDLVEYDGHLYAGIKSSSSGGQVYRYDGGTTWTLVGDNMAGQVASLAVYGGNLYAGTAWGGMKLFRYDDPGWTQVISPVAFSGTRALHVSHGYLLMGDIGYDRFGRWDGTTFYQDVTVSTGSCIWDYEDYGGNVYASAYQGRLWDSSNAINWNVLLGYYDGSMWELEEFQSELYMSYNNGELRASSVPDRGALVYTAPDAIISMTADGDNNLYFGTGGEAGYNTETTGTASVYKYDGTNVALISGVDEMVTGVQVLYIGPGGGNCCVCPGNGDVGDPCVCTRADDEANCVYDLNGQWAPNGCELGTTQGCEGFWCTGDGGCEIPEFSTIALPVASILGLLFFFNYRKRKREQ